MPNETPSDSFLAIDIHELKRVTRDIPVDLYLKLSEDNFAHVFSKTTGLDYRRLSQYIQKGVDKLYVRKVDEAAFKDYLSRPVETLLSNPEVPKEKKIATLLNLTEQAMSEIFTRCDVLEETAENTKKLVNNYIDMMAESPRTLSIVLKLASHGDYLYYHSVAVSIFSMFIARATGQFDRRMTEIVGMGGFLHDIGSIYLPREVTDAPEALSPAQWREMKSHPKMGLRMIEHAPSIPDEVRYIVYQHHEQPNGGGYPNGLQDEVIFYPAKIVAVADSFSALISKRPFRDAYRIDQAIGILQSETGKFDPQLVEILAGIFRRSSSGTEGGAGGDTGGSEAA